MPNSYFTTNYASGGQTRTFLRRFRFRFCNRIHALTVVVTAVPEEMESSGGSFPLDSSRVGSEETHLRSFELESENAAGVGAGDNHYQFHSMSALEILRETVRILRFNLAGFMMISAVLICPVSAVLLSNVLVDQSVVKRLTIRLLLVAKSSGLPLNPLVNQSCQRFADMALSSFVSFPLYVTLLLAKSAILYTVDCTYGKEKFDPKKFYALVCKIWRRIISTYLWVCLVMVSCITLFFVLLIIVCSSCYVTGFSPDMLVYSAMALGFVFSIVFANATIICNIGIVICVLEDVSGPQALQRAGLLIKGQTQVGLLIFLGSTIGMAFIEGLFQHRVKTLSYGDGSSRLWEGPLLVIMHSFVVLVDSMNNAVFYFSCRLSSIEASSVDEPPSILET